MYDIIGDIHGYADTLQAMLLKLGYSINQGVYSHPKRKAIFVGDFVDRGPSIRESLSIVKKMVESGSAFAVMGNHEYNALCYHTKSNGGKLYLRPHSKRNTKNHQQTIEAFKGYEDEWKMYMEWFMTLPLFIDFGNFRVVHACWDNQIINKLNKRLEGGLMDKEFLHRSAVPGTFEYKAVEVLLKGYEIYLPPGFHYTDRDGNSRTKIRVKWWNSKKAVTYKSISLSDDNQLPDTIVPDSKLNKFYIYNSNNKPVFIGHYWNTGKTELLSPNVCCVDFSIANRQKLVVYRWNGEKSLNKENFIIQECLDNRL